MVFFIHPPDGWEVDHHYLTVNRPPVAVSQEVRKVEFELKSPSDFAQTAILPAYVLYYVCEDVNGTCLYRRQDISVRVEAKTD